MKVYGRCKHCGHNALCYLDEIKSGALIDENDAYSHFSYSLGRETEDCLYKKCKCLRAWFEVKK